MTKSRRRMVISIRQAVGWAKAQAPVHMFAKRAAQRCAHASSSAFHRSAWARRCAVQLARRERVARTFAHPNSNRPGGQSESATVESAPRGHFHTRQNETND